ncbi:selenium-binding family protein [Streptomyces sp. Caat 7-52]|uniref:selenium-binding family protein n=1 Tax=Streptomyces sp. Caat 7-52 TaxID=2949637 RepID=UPI00203596BB|nr:selenium-binding family protein [Streptomyces sp. Caat 7-52]
MRELDSQFLRHCHRLPMSLEQYLHHLVWLAESYVSHLVGGVVHPDRERRSMVVPRRWDGMLASRIFGLEAGERPTKRQMQAVNQLYKREGPLKFADEFEGLAELRELLSSVTDLVGGVGPAHAP